MLAIALAIVAVLVHGSAADEVIYADGTISSSWQDWSWGSTINYAATDLFEGTSSISVTNEAWSALSVYDTSVFAGSFAGLEFDIAGDNPDVSIYLTDSVTNDNSPTIPLSAFDLPVNATTFTTVKMDFSNLPPNGQSAGTGNWDRISWQGGANGATYHLDNINLVTAFTVVPDFLSAEPMANNLIAVTTQGAVNLSSVAVHLNGESITVSSNQTVVPADTPSISITYLTLAKPFTAGNLTISTPNGTFTYNLGNVVSGSVNQNVTRAINPHIYGINFPTDVAYVEEIGVPLSRWGGNAATAYNWQGDFTNLDNDWYFENSQFQQGNADEWLGMVSGAGSDTILAIPSLDWVAKDNTSYSYPAMVYPDQEAYDPYKPDAGDGLFPNGSWVAPPNPANIYTPWTPANASVWLKSLATKPTFVTVDNEIEIASNTHQDMHPDPLGYDEIVQRVLNVSAVARNALPNAFVSAPSTCAWWYYWTSMVGEPDKTAHDNMDFLPYFLQQMAAHHNATGVKPLDYLDIHYYFAADTSANDQAAKELRLRLSRSFWDPTYVDESWIGTSTPQNSQPNATIVELIPRMQALIADYYPGLKLSIGEWSSTDDTDVTGGLLVADSLGIFGRYGLDSATYWYDPDPTSAAGLAFWLYRGNGLTFGPSSAQVSINNFDPDTLGVYAATNGGQNVSLVIVNKDLNNTLALDLTGVPTGTYFMRHFGGEAGVAKFETTITLSDNNYIVVPAGAAVFLQEVTASCADQYGQCGGSGYQGTTCCKSPYTCKITNTFYSACS